jgi:hypothetical protein
LDGSMEADGWERVDVGRRRTVKAARRMKEGKGCRLDGGIVALCGRAGPERQCLRGRARKAANGAEREVWTAPCVSEEAALRRSNMEPWENA